jgi:hypothetical protein
MLKVIKGQRWLYSYNGIATCILEIQEDNHLESNYMIVSCLLKQDITPRYAWATGVRDWSFNDKDFKYLAGQDKSS